MLDGLDTSNRTVSVPESTPNTEGHPTGRKEKRRSQVTWQQRTSIFDLGASLAGYYRDAKDLGMRSHQHGPIAMITMLTWSPEPYRPDTGVLRIGCLDIMIRRVNQHDHDLVSPG